MTMDRANRRSRRRAGWIVLAVGVVFAVAGIVLPFILGAAFVSFPGGPVDQTTQANGSYTQLVNPATLAPQTGQTRDLCLNRRLRTVETTGNTVILQQDDSELIGTLSPPPKVPDCTLPWLHVSQRYAIDQDSVRNVASPQAYAYAPGNTVDRSPAYSVNLPLGTGNGPYLMWDDATGSTYPLAADGSTTVDRLQLEKFHGHLDAAPVSAAFLATLAPLGLTSTMTLDQLTPQLTAAGVDVNQLRNVAVLQLNGNDNDVTSDRAVVDGILKVPPTISYLLATDVQLLVYPKTGTIVSADVRQTLEMRPDITGIDRVLAIISQPKYAGRAALVAAAAELAKLIAKPPTTMLSTVSYSPTLQSVASVAAFAKSRGDDIDRLTVTIPLIIGLVGLVLILVGVALLVWSGRRTGGAAQGHASPAET